MVRRIDEKFQELRAQNRAGFIAYICAGDPSLAQTAEITLALENAGVDLIELGVPFSDPLADGSVNQAAAQRALQAGATVPGVFDCVRKIRSRSEIPIVLYSYLNPIYIYGFEKFHRDAANAGVDGLLILDLPPHEAGCNEEFQQASESAGLARIQLIAPTTPEERYEEITKAGSGFIYCVSREGVTGERSEVASGLEKMVRLAKAHSNLPVAVGFGISTPDQVREVADHADAVVVGSAIVRRIAGHADDPKLAENIAEFVRPLAAAVADVNRS